MLFLQFACKYALHLRFCGWPSWKESENRAVEFTIPVQGIVLKFENNIIKN
jgi:hypothetical protein